MVVVGISAGLLGLGVGAAVAVAELRRHEWHIVVRAVWHGTVLELVTGVSLRRGLNDRREHQAIARLRTLRALQRMVDGSDREP